MLSRILRLAGSSSILTRKQILARCRARPVSTPSLLLHRRMLTTPAPHTNVSHISLEKYHLLSDATMDTLLESLENLLDVLGNPSYEVEYHSGVLTLSLGEHGTYVINKQPPNKQIWLSSPFSGPKRYDYSEADDDWVYSRDGLGLGNLMNTELSNALQQDVDLRLSTISARLD